jgi:hypothetical protein
MSARSLSLSLSVLFLALAAPPASLAVPEAADAAAREDRFLIMDEDGDGALSPEEFAAGLPHLRPSAFPAMDADQDGRLSREEWLRVRMEHRAPGLEARPGTAGGGPASAAPGNGTGRGPDLLLPREGNNTSR